MEHSSATSRSAHRSFPCVHCRKQIQIPANLPPTKAPCPHCQEEVTSPSLEALSEIDEVAPPRQTASAAASVKPAEAVSSAVAREPARPSLASEDVNHLRRKKMKWLLPIAFTVVVLALLPAILMSSFGSNAKTEDTDQIASEIERASLAERKEKVYLSGGWESDAREALEQFFQANSISQRAATTLRGAENEPLMRDFYDRFPFDESDTPVSGFSAINLAPEDTSRGIFLMNYNRPEQYDIRRFFRPVAPLRVEYGLDEMDPLLVGESALKNFTLEPVRIMAYFSRQSGNKLLLDWATFRQTKHRLFRQFIENAVPGKGGVFRVFLQEDVDLDGRETAEASVFRISDPAYQEDHVKVLVTADSEIGRAFDELRWRGRSLPKPPVRSGTIELEWSQGDQPELRVKRFLCWEFLGLGGELDNWKDGVKVLATFPEVQVEE